MPSRAEFTPQRLCTDALLLGAALILSWLEILLPMPAIPGFKPGLCNIAVLLAVHRFSLADGAIISLSRIAVMSILFGSVTSFAFSLGGGILSLAVMGLTKPMHGRFSLAGISVLSAAAHNIGQTIAACLVFTSPAPLGMLWWLLLLALPTGLLTGIAAELTARRLNRGAR